MKNAGIKAAWYASIMLLGCALCVLAAPCQAAYASSAAPAPQNAAGSAGSTGSADSADYADSTDPTEGVDKQLNGIDFGGVDKIIRDNGAPVNSLRELVDSVISGKLDLSPGGLLRSGLRLIFNELYAQASLIRSLLIVALLSALFKVMTEAFRNKGVGELGFYASYVVLIVILFQSFQIALGITQGLVGTVAGLMEACVPLVVTLLIMTGSVATSYVFNPLILMASGVLTEFVSRVLLPVIAFAAMIHIVNYLTENAALSKLAELFKDGCQFVVKLMCVLFVMALSLQKISMPILDNVTFKTAKSAVGAIPVVGGAINGAADVVLLWAGAARSGVLIALLILAVMICAVPIIKVFALFLVYRLTAAVIQPVADKRIAECIDGMGDFTLAFGSVCVLTALMFIVMAVITLAF